MVQEWDPPRWLLPAVIAVGGLVRFWFVLSAHPPMEFEYSDMQAYVDRAIHMADPRFESGPMDWFFPSGTAAFLSIWVKLAGRTTGLQLAAISQAVQATLALPLLYLGTRRYFSRGVATVAVILLATHYLAIEFSSFFMSEPGLSFYLIVSFALLEPKKPMWVLASGVMLGLASWHKTQAVLLLPLWCLPLLKRRDWLNIALMGVGAMVVLLPVSTYATARTNRPVFVSSNGGQNFAIGQCPVSWTTFTDPRTNTSMGFSLPAFGERKQRGWQEAGWPEAKYTEPFWNSSYYMHEGWNCVKQYPMHAFRMIFIHITDDFAGLPGAMIVPWPGGFTKFRTPCVASNLYFSLLITPLALFGLWVNRRSEGMWFCFGAPLLALLATTVLFHGDPRFRAPWDPFFFIAAAAALEWMWKKRQLRRAPVSAPAPSLPPSVIVGGAAAPPADAPLPS